MTKTWHLRNEVWQLPAIGGIMGILNVTPDSFSDGGRHNSPEQALQHAAALVQAGADIIDVGGESTRPGSLPVAIEEELRRTIPVIRALREQFPALKISIDTRHVSVAAAALDAGADIINDISGLSDSAMRRLCAERPCGIVLMHMQGTPETMQQAPHYDNVVEDVRQFFIRQLNLAQADGISPERICLDPGIGFGKTTTHNLALIKHLRELTIYNGPMMMALSRKRFMGEILRNPAAARSSALPTVTLSLMAADAGADLHRVHDVEELHQALTLRHALLHTS